VLEPGEVVARVAECVFVALARLVELFAGVFAECFEHEEAVVAAGFEEALVEEGGDLVEVGPADGFCGVEGEGAAEDRQAAEGGLRVGVEEVVAPLNGGAQGALTLGQVVGAAGEERQRGVEALQ
jgi:hypothetical protein